MKNTLVINWDKDNPKVSEPYTEVFKNIKSEEKALRLIGRRKMSNIVTAEYKGKVIYVRPEIEQVELPEEIIESINETEINTEPEINL